MTHTNGPALRIQRLTIRNYKGIEHLELEFPEPRMPGDPDVFVLGSENGLGKTSVLECCAILLLCVSLGGRQIEVFDRGNRVNLPALLIRAGEGVLEIDGVVLSAAQVEVRAAIRVDRAGSAQIAVEPSVFPPRALTIDDRIGAEDLLKGVLGMAAGPALDECFLMFHSYRKVQEGDVDMGALSSPSTRRDPSRYMPSNEPAISHFKYLMLVSLLGDANVLALDTDDAVDTPSTRDKLNDILETFARAKLGKLRPNYGNALEFLIERVDDGSLYPYDALSSGQKEIVSTLALVWYHTRNSPRVVLIDEPELHLNAQWRRSFVKTLFSIAPKNQYIMATHSEFVMDSVDADRRILLSATPEAVG